MTNGNFFKKWREYKARVRDQDNKDSEVIIKDLTKLPSTIAFALLSSLVRVEIPSINTSFNILVVDRLAREIGNLTMMVTSKERYGHWIFLKKKLKFYTSKQFLKGKMDIVIRHHNIEYTSNKHCRCTEKFGGN